MKEYVDFQWGRGGYCGGKWGGGWVWWAIGWDIKKLIGVCQT